MIKKKTVSKKPTASKKKTGRAKPKPETASKGKSDSPSKSTVAAKKSLRPSPPNSRKAQPEKKQPVINKTARIKPASKTTAVKKTEAVKKTTRVRTVKTKEPTTEQTEVLKALAAKGHQHTPPIFKLPSKRRATPAIFSLDDVREVIKVRKAEPKPVKKRVQKPASVKKSKPTEAATKVEHEIIEPRVLEAASIADVLGFNPAGKPKEREDEKKVLRKYLKHYRRLVNLRNQMEDVLNLHTKDTLKRSIKEDSGDLSDYSQHMADSGTDNFDRDFALSLVSSEQEILKEIDEAIKRIFAGTYGICEVTGKPIGRARLAAVPYTRFSVQGQTEFEKTKPKSSQRTGLFIDSRLGDIVKFTDEDSEE